MKNEKSARESIIQGHYGEASFLWDFVRNLSENAKLLPSKRFKAYSRGATGLRRLVDNEVMGSVMEPTVQNDILSRIRGLQMIAFSAARYRTEKYMITLPSGINNIALLEETECERTAFDQQKQVEMKTEHCERSLGQVACVFTLLISFSF